MKIQLKDITIHCEISGKEEGEPVVLSHSLACSLRMWAPQVEALEDAFRVLRYDTRGHGSSDAPKGPYSFEMLGADALGLLDALDIERAHWVGLSMGGMIGQHLAIRYPDRIKSLTLCDTGPVMAEEMQPIWQERIDEARGKGMAARLQQTFEGWFPPDFLKQDPPVLEDLRNQFLATPVEGYVGCIQAIRSINYLEEIKEIAAPTLIIVGKEDLGTPVEVAELMHDRIKGSKLVVLPAAAHISNLAQPGAFNDALLTFLKGLQGGHGS